MSLQEAKREETNFLSYLRSDASSLIRILSEDIKQFHLLMIRISAGQRRTKLKKFENRIKDKPGSSDILKRTGGGRRGGHRLWRKNGDRGRGEGRDNY
jgi:hypothetical protein